MNISSTTTLTTGNLDNLEKFRRNTEKTNSSNGVPGKNNVAKKYHLVRDDLC
jgi:hypothetical protein